MILNKENSSSFFNKYVKFVDDISLINSYDNNIRHLLYLIVPSFIIKYGIENERTILDCFRNVPIYIGDHHNKRVTATFNRVLKMRNGEYYSTKYIILNDFKEASLTFLLDNLIHEYNHAVNSINNEISFDNDYVRLRTGICYLIYNKKDLSFVRKSTAVFLEEVINTVQTEEIIKIIDSFYSYDFDNIEFSNMLFSLRREILDNGVRSKAYGLQRDICEELLNNKTFFPTITKLRFKGNVDDIPFLFDSVIGKNGSFNRLLKDLDSINKLEIKYESTLFKKIVLNKIINKSQDIISLIREYDQKCIYK